MKNYLFIPIILILLLFDCKGVFCKYGDLPDLGNGYKFETLNCKTLEIVDAENNVIIEGIILNYSFNPSFIIVSQRPWDLPDIPNLKEMNYSKRKDAFEKSSFTQYWIINKKENSEFSFDKTTKLGHYSNVYGPFEKDEYLQKRQELGITEDLILKEKLYKFY